MSKKQDIRTKSGIKRAIVDAPERPPPLRIVKNGCK
jgi:hypothetical protein